MGGYRIIQARNGKEALELYDEHGAEIDVVLLDHSMPGLTGEQVLERMIASDPGVRVLLFTGYAPKPDRYPAAAAVLRKPLSASTLFAALAEHARTRS